MGADIEIFALRNTQVDTFRENKLGDEWAWQKKLEKLIAENHAYSIGYFSHRSCHSFHNELIKSNLRLSEVWCYITQPGYFKDFDFDNLFEVATESFDWRCIYNSEVSQKFFQEMKGANLQKTMSETSKVEYFTRVFKDTFLWFSKGDLPDLKSYNLVVLTYY